MSIVESGQATALTAFFWLAVALGLGAVILSSGVLFCRFFTQSQPRAQTSGKLAGGLHAITIAALVMLICASTALALVSGDLALTPEHIFELSHLEVTWLAQTTIAFGLLLTTMVVNEVLIDRHLIPLAHRPQRPLLRHLTPGEIMRIATLGSASLVTWSAIPAITFIAESEPWPASQLLAHVGLIWIAVAGAGTLLLLGLRQLLYPRLRPRPYGVRTLKTSPQKIDSETSATPAPPGKAAQLPVQLATINTACDLASSADTQRADTRNARPLPITVDQVVAACKTPLLAVAAIGLASNILMLGGPLYMLQIYDRVLTSRSEETLAALTVLIVGLYLFMGVLDLIRVRVMARLSIRFDQLLAPQLLARTIAVAPVDVDPRSTHPLRDLEQLRQFAAGPAPLALMDLPWAPLYFAVIFLMHPLLGWVAVAGGAALIALSMANQHLTHAPLQQASESRTRSHALAEAGQRNAEVIAALGMAGAVLRRWSAEHCRSVSRQLTATDLSSAFTIIGRTSRLLLQSLMLAVGAWLALQDAVSAGAMIAASIIAARALAPIEQVVGHWRGVSASQAAFQRCRALLADASGVPERMNLPEPRGEITVSNLYVAPLGQREPVLKGLSFKIKPGDGLAVVGPSAAGKSTLARALVGLWPIRHGDIRLDGASIEQWAPERLGRRVGYLPQEVQLFDVTVAENIARLSPEPSSNAVVAAAVEAGAHEMILGLSHGYDTRVGQNGAALSGGQRQRIALARAFYSNPAVIVLDEPNANLDHEGETALISAIDRARSVGRTVIVIAHRQSILASVNMVLVLVGGKQMGFGLRDQVLSRQRLQSAANAQPGSEQLHAKLAAQRSHGIGWG